MTAADAATKLSVEEEMLRDLRQRIQAWRIRSGKSDIWMPKALWEEIIAAAQLCGIRRAARGMGLDFDELKNRVHMVEPVEPAANDFIELPGVSPAAPVTSNEVTMQSEPIAPAPIRGADEAIVEVEAPDGAHLTVRIPMSGFNLHILVQEFARRT
jgi:hypothetical protein